MWRLYDYLDGRDPSHNLIREWTVSLQRPTRSKLKLRLALIAKDGENERDPKGFLSTGLLSGPLKGEYRHLYEVKVHGQQNVRVLACRGPADGWAEITLLLGVSEKDNRLPPGALDEAIRRYEAVQADARRRRLHERDSI